MIWQKMQLIARSVYRSPVRHAPAVVATTSVHASPVCHSSLRRSDHNLTKQNAPLLATLQVNRTRRSLLAIQRPARDTRNLLAVDNRLAILNNRNPAANQRDVEGLPH